MPEPVQAVLAVLASYLLGSIPFGLLIGRWVAGIDIRKVGSGNVGATNVGRAIGKGWFVLVFLLDAAKGAGPVLVLAPLAAGGGAGDLLRVACAFAAVLGHVFSVWLKFQGGKGVATTAGAISAIAPLAGGLALAAFLGVFLLSRYVSLASMAAAVAFVPLTYVGDPSPEVTAFAIAVAVLVLVRHRSNIARLRNGTEPKIGTGRGDGASVASEGSHDG